MDNAAGEVVGIDIERVLSLIEARSAEICDAAAELDIAGLEAPSSIAGWSRLTIVCHLRYGAQACRQITRATLAGRPSAFYPGGRELQRPYTLKPALGEPPVHVVPSLEHECALLGEVWRAVPDAAWALPLIADDDDDDPVAPTLSGLAHLRLSEVMTHGDDLDVGLAPAHRQGRRQ